MEPARKRRKISVKEVEINDLPNELLSIILNLACPDVDALSSLGLVSRKWSSLSKYLEKEILDRTRWTIVNSRDLYYGYLGELSESIGSSLESTSGRGGIHSKSIYNCLKKGTVLRIDCHIVRTLSKNKIIDLGIYERIQEEECTEKYMDYEDPFYDFSMNPYTRREVQGDYDCTIYDGESESEEDLDAYGCTGDGFMNEELYLMRYHRLTHAN